MKKWIIILIVAVIVSLIGYNYIYQDHRDIENEKPEYTMSASEMTQFFSKDETSAELKFLNKTIEISGLISEISTKEITIDNKVFCQFSENIESTIRKKSKINIKGRVIGYDNLLEQVKLDQCSITN